MKNTRNCIKCDCPKPVIMTQCLESDEIQVTLECLMCHHKSPASVADTFSEALPEAIKNWNTEKDDVL